MKKLNLSVVGLGKLGSPLLAVLANSGHKVIGVDTNLQFIDMINSIKAPVMEPGLQSYISNASERIKATNNYEEAILGSDLTFVIVPTPSNLDGSFSNEFILEAVEKISKVLKQKNSYHVINITSTVMPGSCDGKIIGAIEFYSGKRVGKDIGLCYSPEFIALGSVIKNMEYPDMCLIGESDERCGTIIENIYKGVVKNNPKFMRMNLINAELTKIAVNTYVTMKISYANMISDLCEKISGADVSIVCKAIGMDSRIGEKYLSPGMAFGGPCFPRDNQAYISLANKLGSKSALAAATKEINDNQINKLVDLIGSLSENGNLGFIGASYKPNTPVIEESAVVKTIDRLLHRSQNIFVWDNNAGDNLIARYGSKITLVDDIDDLIKESEVVILSLSSAFDSQVLNRKMLSAIKGKKFLECWGRDFKEIVEKFGGRHFSLGYKVI
jgi:UDPglucose 6-dehydrogenase